MDSSVNVNYSKNVLKEPKKCKIIKRNQALSNNLNDNNVINFSERNMNNSYSTNSLSNQGTFQTKKNQTYDTEKNNNEANQINNNQNINKNNDKQEDMYERLKKEGNNIDFIQTLLRLKEKQNKIDANNFKITKNNTVINFNNQNLNDISALSKTDINSNSNNILHIKNVNSMNNMNSNTSNIIINVNNISSIEKNNNAINLNDKSNSIEGKENDDKDKDKDQMLALLNVFPVAKEKEFNKNDYLMKKNILVNYKSLSMDNSLFEKGTNVSSVNKTAIKNNNINSNTVNLNNQNNINTINKCVSSNNSNFESIANFNNQSSSNFFSQKSPLSESKNQPQSAIDNNKELYRTRTNKLNRVTNSSSHFKNNNTNFISHNKEIQGNNIFNKYESLSKHLSYNNMGSTNNRLRDIAVSPTKNNNNKDMLSKKDSNLNTKKKNNIKQNKLKPNSNSTANLNSKGKNENLHKSASPFSDREHHFLKNNNSKLNKNINVNNTIAAIPSSNVNNNKEVPHTVIDLFGDDEEKDENMKFESNSKKIKEAKENKDAKDNKENKDSKNIKDNKTVVLRLPVSNCTYKQIAINKMFEKNNGSSGNVAYFNKRNNYDSINTICNKSKLNKDKSHINNSNNKGGIKKKEGLNTQSNVIKGNYAFKKKGNSNTIK